MARPQPTDGARMVYLIKRKTETTREELIAHWFANHMPGVIARNDRNRASGAAYAYHYVATLFDPVPEQNLEWDGMAQLWYSAPLPRPSQASAVEPYDTFQEKVEPYWPWATREYVIIGWWANASAFDVEPALPVHPKRLLQSHVLRRAAGRRRP